MDIKLNNFIQSVVKGIGIAAGGGGLTLGAGQINLINTDIGTVFAVVIFSVSFNILYQAINKLMVTNGK